MPPGRSWLNWASPGSRTVMSRRYSVHCYATVRVEFTGVIASTPQDAARIVDALFDWEEHQHLAEYAEELTEFLVDIEGDSEHSRSRRFNFDFDEIGS